MTTSLTMSGSAFAPVDQYQTVSGKALQAWPVQHETHKTEL